MAGHSLRAAVRGLRLALGKTQTEFGTMIGKSLPTIQRYETLVPPKGKTLLKLERLASEKRFDEYARTFREALRRDLGLDLPDMSASAVEVPFPIVVSHYVGGPKTEEQRQTHDALQALLCQAEWPGVVGEHARKDLKTVDRGLRRVRLQLEEAGEGAYVTADRVRAVVRLVRDGIPPINIAEKLDISTQEVEFLLALYGEKRK
jgi:transcriptional regulator with XRE-family HTH domain